MYPKKLLLTVDLQTKLVKREASSRYDLDAETIGWKRTVMKPRRIYVHAMAESCSRLTTLRMSKDTGSSILRIFLRSYRCNGNWISRQLT